MNSENMIKMENNRELKVTLYCELFRLWGGFFYKNVGTGFLTSYANQKKALKTAGIYFTEDLREESRIFQANSHGPYTFFLAWCFRRKGRKIIFYAHSTVEDLRMNAKFLWIFSAPLRWYLSKLYNFADAVVCPSRYTVRLLREKYSVAGEKTVYISNGTDVHKFESKAFLRNSWREKMGLSDSDLLAVNVAMSVKRKGTDTFVFLGKEFPQVKFAWFGKIFTGLFSYKIPKHTDNVSFLGFVPDISEAYVSADIFLFPSYEEQQGISVLEAGAAGLPLLTRDIPVYRDWLIDGEHCYKAGSDEEFKRKFQILVENPDKRRELADNLRRHVISEHSMEAVGEKLSSLYRELLKKN